MCEGLVLILKIVLDLEAQTKAQEAFGMFVQRSYRRKECVTALASITSCP
jgi:hypothetical protein